MIVRQTDLFAGAASEAAPVGPAPVSEAIRALAAHVPDSVRFGTSSWTFPGWTGIVYDREVSTSVLAEHGLAAYGHHPLLRSVGVDRSYYAPIPARALESYAEAVPVDFRFLLKAPRACLFPTLGPAGERSTLNPSFLDGELAVREFVDPTLQALGERTGPLVFQFPAMNLRSLGGPVAFADRLGGFLRKLPRGPLYAVEVRNRELLGAAYRDALSGPRVVHCFNVHPTMPSLEAQATAVGHDPSGTLVVRWMLGHGLPYETARDRYRPFNRLVAEDEATRAAIVAACRRTVAEKGEAVVIVNNKAEGCSPLSVVQLARLLVEG